MHAAETCGVQRQRLHKGDESSSTVHTFFFKKKKKEQHHSLVREDGTPHDRQRDNQLTQKLFLKNILFFTKEALGASVRSMACVHSSCWETKIIEQALG